jgi:hypothetical protein
MADELAKHKLAMWNKRDSTRIDFYVVFHVDIEATMYLGAASHRITSSRAGNQTSPQLLAFACRRASILAFAYSEIEIDLCRGAELLLLPFVHST